jgi:subtilisin family serine protease
MTNNRVMTNNDQQGGIRIMRAIDRVVVTAIGSICMLGSAMAAELTGAQIKDSIMGKSVYLETTATSATGTAGQGVIYYDPNGSALFKTPKGVIWHGTWKIEGNTACIDWKEKPNNGCVKYDKQGDTTSVVDVATGQTRAKVMKIAAGNAENIAP